ncbi:MAG: FecR domain-containing protein [Spirochaetales bacterium]|nr:FecR domain-containing protein [Spirochaetales bacterium]
MRDLFDDNTLKNLITKAASPERPSKEARHRILAVIQEKTNIKPLKRPVSPFRLTRPGVAVAAAAVLIVIPLIVVISVLLQPSYRDAIPFIVYSHRGGFLGDTDNPLTKGYELGHREMIRTGRGEQVIIERKDEAVVYLFSESLLTISSGAERKRQTGFSLDKGSLYINKYSPNDPNTYYAVTIRNEYIFVLKGTRVYFSIGLDATVTVILYDGLLSIERLPETVRGIPSSLQAPVKLQIFTDGKWKTSGIEAWADDEKALDELLRMPSPYTGLIAEIAYHRRQQFENAALEPSVRRQPEATPVRELEKPPYIVTALGEIGFNGMRDDTVNYFASTSDEGRLYFVNQHELFIIENGTILKVPGIDPSSSFRSKPLIMGSTLCLFTANTLLLLDTHTMKADREIPFPRDGSIDLHYIPHTAGNLIIIPVQNHGYYTIDPVSDDPRLLLLHKEAFPLSPVPADGRIVIGAYYASYLGIIDFGGAILAKTPLQGNTYVNIVHQNNKLYLYSEKADRYSIAIYDTALKPAGGIDLPQKIATDFIVTGTTIWGIDTNGTLFYADTVSGQKASVTRIHGGALSSRHMRFLELYRSDDSIMAACENGTIVLVNSESRKVSGRITVDTGERLYTAPIVTGNFIHVVSNTGRVFRIEKNNE